MIYLEHTYYYCFSILKQACAKAISCIALYIVSCKSQIYVIMFICKVRDRDTHTGDRLRRLKISEQEGLMEICCYPSSCVAGLKNCGLNCKN